MSKWDKTREAITALPNGRWKDVFVHLFELLEYVYDAIPTEE